MSGLSKKASEMLFPLIESLARLPRVGAVDVVEPPEEVLDLRLRLRGPGGQRAQVGVEFVKSVQPAHVALLTHRAGRSPRVLPLIATTTLSERTRAALRQAGLGYWDSGGSLCLELPWGYYYVDRPVPQAEKRRLKALFSGASAQAVHAMLLQPERAWKGVELAREAEVSEFTAHRVLQRLEEELYATREGRGPGTTRQLVRPGELLDAWAHVHSLKDYHWHGYYLRPRSPEALGAAVMKGLKAVGSEGAITLEWAAQLVAPFLTQFPQRLHVLVPPGFSAGEALGGAGLREVPEGENVVLLEPRGVAPLMFRQRVRRLALASNVQLYLDLMASPRRGQEQARHLREVRLGY